MKYILFAIGLYLLYQFIFRLLLPVYMATRKIKKSFREMQEHMQQQQQQQRAASSPQQEAPKQGAASKGNLGEYIEFEEVR